ncbi:MAG: MBL fold metallo-hydrolase [Betaproteobacteria bacterium]|nr:MBL fold metallo-hydrolase [Betaproteobacteria bacterium]
MKVTLLGTGTPTPSLRRASSGYLIEVGDDVLVWDHGPGSHHRLLQTGKRAVDVTHMFFSHLHYDHCADFVRLFLTRWDMGADRIPELKVYGPPHTRRMIELLFGDERAAFGPDINARIKHQGSIDVFVARGGTPPRKWPKPEITEIRAGEKVHGPDWTLTVGAASHVQPYLDCYGFRLDADEGSICYSGDSGGVAPGIVELARGCDVLIHMNHYFSGTEPTEIYRLVCGNHIDTAKVAQKAGVKTLVLTHMLEQIDQPGVREQIIREIGRIYEGPVIWGEDLMEIPIKGPKLHRME